MKTVELKKYFDKTNQKVISSLLKSGDKHPVKTLHELRVEIKKIRFICNVIGHFNKSPDVEMLGKPYEEVFKKAGKIRSLQMQKKLVSHFDESDILKDLLKGNKHAEEKLMKKFFKDRELHADILKAYKPMINAEIEKTINPDLKRYANHLIKFLFDNIKTKIIITDAHKHRKKIKELIFIGRFSKELHSYISNRINFDSADKLQEKIGGWHDKYELFKAISKNSNDVKNSEQKKYRKAIRQIGNMINKDLDEIKLLVSDFHLNINLITLK